MRPDNWPERLAAEVEAARHKPYRLRRHDCASWARHIAQTVLELDLPPLPPYRTAYEARRAWTRLGGTGKLSDGVSAWLDLEPESAAFAHRAHPVALEIKDVDTGKVREHLAVRIDTRAALPGPKGLVLVPLSLATVCWRLDRA